MIELHDFTAGQVLRAADLNLLEAAVQELRAAGGYSTVVVGCATTVESRRFYMAGGVRGVSATQVTVGCGQWAENPLAAATLPPVVSFAAGETQLSLGAGLTHGTCTAEAPMTAWVPHAADSLNGSGPLRTVAEQEGTQWCARTMFFGQAQPPLWVRNAAVQREAEYPTSVVVLPGAWQKVYEGLQAWGWLGGGDPVFRLWGVEAGMDMWGFVRLRGYCREQ